jgi:hypothetical protein
MHEVPYLHMYKPHFLTRIYPPKLGCGLCTEYYVLLTTDPATLVLYVVKLPVETTSVWDCYLSSYCTGANMPTYYRCISIFWLHESSRHHRFPEVGRSWHHWQITINAASNNQSAANAVTNIVLSHRQNLVWLIYELLLFPNSWPKNLGAAYTRANTVIYIHCILSLDTHVWFNAYSYLFGIYKPCYLVAADVNNRKDMWCHIFIFSTWIYKINMSVRSLSTVLFLTLFMKFIEDACIK